MANDNENPKSDEEHHPKPLNSEIEEMVKQILKNEADKKEANEAKKYPEDCFSLIQLNRPSTCIRMRCFLFGMFVLCFQISIYAVYLLNAAAAERAPDYLEDTYGEDYPQILWNGGNWGHTHGKASNVEQLDGLLDGKVTEELSSKPFRWKAQVETGIKFAQGMAMIAYIVFPEGGMSDLITAFQSLPPKCCCSGWSALVLVFRFIHSAIAVYTVSVLILTSATPIDVFLNFAAMSFVSQLDETAFGLAKEGTFGKVLEEESKNIAEAEGESYQKQELSEEPKKEGVEEYPQKEEPGKEQKAESNKFLTWTAMAVVAIFFLLGLIPSLNCEVTKRDNVHQCVVWRTPWTMEPLLKMHEKMVPELRNIH